MWVLILTIFSVTGGAEAKIMTVPNFTSETACLSAASEWAKLQKNAIGDRSYYIRTNALCAKL